jgi:SAM-dependent methyltransferase
MKHRCGQSHNWDQIGDLQYNFLINKGLKRNHNLLDVGCGGLRLGCRVIPYLDKGRYYGIDISQSFIDGGISEELDDNVFIGKSPSFICNGEFDFTEFDVKFDYVIAHSVFTHLPMNYIQQCLVNIRSIMSDDCVFYATYFDVSSIDIIDQEWNTVSTKMSSDPYHQHISFYRYLANELGFNLEEIGNWGHPREQSMLGFSL